MKALTHYGSKDVCVETVADPRNELNDSGGSVTVLMPGATEAKFLERAHMLDTKVDTEEKDHLADLAREGYKAMLEVEGDVVSGGKNTVWPAVACVTPSALLAAQHRKMAETGSARK